MIVKYNGKDYEFKNELQKGEKELDMFTEEDEERLRKKILENKRIKKETENKDNKNNV